MFSIIKVSQYSAHPSKVHYQTVKYGFKYLDNIKYDGLYCWYLPILQLPSAHNTTNNVTVSQYPPSKLYGFVDTDWGGETKHWRSVSGIALFLGGAPIAYRSKFQPDVSLS